MSLLEDINLPEFNPDDILCNPKSYRIGGGGLTRVWVGYNKILKQTVAIKIFRLTGTQKDILQIVEHAKEEGKLMQLARHENVVQVFGFVKWPSAFGIVMEYCECGNLKELLQIIHNKITLCVHILSQVASGIAFLHNLPDQFVIHGNPNPYNVLLTNKMDVKLSGFGFAELVSSSDDSRMSKTQKHVFTPFYAAPEKLIKPAMKPTKALDVYIFAISTYEVLTGRKHFFDAKPDLEKIYKQMRFANAQDQQTVKVIMDMIEKCLNDDPLKRPSMKEVVDVVLKLLDEQYKDVILLQAETVTLSVCNAFDFSNLENLVPISNLTPFHPITHTVPSVNIYTSIGTYYRSPHFHSTHVADSFLASDVKLLRGSFSTAQCFSGSNVNEPVVKRPLVKEPVVKIPHVKEPVVNIPLVEEPVVKIPLVKEPVVVIPDVKILEDAKSLTLPDKKGVKYSESQATDPKEVASSSGVTSLINPKQIRDYPFVEADVDETGATLNVGDCKVTFPVEAVWEKVRIKISVLYQEADDVIRLTPVLRCEPHGLLFRKNIEIILPTFYHAEGDALDVAVRRAKDKFSSFEKIGMDLLCNDTRHFKFTTDQFSLFDYILFDASKRMNLLREKVLIFGVRPNTGEAPLEIVCCVLVCHNKESAVKLNNINKLVETHFLLRYEDYKLEVLLRGEHLDVLRAKVRDARCERDETLFPMKKNNGHGWINDYVEVCLRSESNETLVEKIVPINKEDRVPRPQPDVTTSFSRSTFHNATVNTSLRHNERKTDSFWSRCTLL